MTIMHNHRERHGFERLLKTTRRGSRTWLPEHSSEIVDEPYRRRSRRPWIGSDCALLDFRIELRL